MSMSLRLSMSLRRTVNLAGLAAVALWVGSTVPAAAGGLSLSLSVPGNPGEPSVAVSVGQPGFYGELTVGDLPAPPPVIYAQPAIIERNPYAGPPIYLRVPAGYERHWAEHCAAYHACARRVYFVRDDWYSRVYVPHYREVHAREHYRAEQHYREERYREEERAHHENYGHEYRDHGADHGDDHGAAHDAHGHDHDHDPH